MIANTGKVLFIVFAFFIVSCASTASQVEPVAEVHHKTIAPNEIHEGCIKAQPGQKILYSFKASKSVNFNIHYHDGGKVNYAVFVPGVSCVNEGTYNVETEQDYCLMWTNTNDTEIQLSYSYKVTN